jgi:hypothetical protein
MSKETIMSSTYERIPASQVQVGDRAYPRGIVVAVNADSPASGWTTVEVQGYDRWNLQTVGVYQYSPRRGFRRRIG